MIMDSHPKLHWTQRIALVRHNLHAARRTRDYTFFKTLQAQALIDGTDHVAVLQSILCDDADSILSTLDNLNAGIAYVHQDAFKAVYDSAKSTMYKAGNSPSSRRSLLRVDISQQRDMSDHAIDKTANSAIQLIEAQPVHCQDAVANAWITGATIIADAVCVCLREMEEIEKYMDDFIRLEYSWSCIQNSVDAAISALRGIFNLMANANANANTSPAHPPSRKLSVASIMSGSEVTNGSRSRTSSMSTASALGMIKRAFSHAHLNPPPAAKASRTESLSVPDTSSRGFRMSMSAAVPTRIPSFADHPHTILTTIPPTPSVYETPINDTMSPFKEKDYFSFDMERDRSASDKQTSPGQELMQLDSLDPLSPPSGEEGIKMPVPLTLRRLSASFGNSARSPIAV